MLFLISLFLLNLYHIQLELNEVQAEGLGSSCKKSAPLCDRVSSRSGSTWSSGTASRSACCNGAVGRVARSSMSPWWRTSCTSSACCAGTHNETDGPQSDPDGRKAALLCRGSSDGLVVKIDESGMCRQKMGV